MQATNPESETVYYTYDNNGNLLNQTDNRGIVTTHGYDALNRMSWKAYSDGTPSVTYQYDPNIPNGKGRLASIFTSSASNSSINSTTNFTNYDPMGNVRASSQIKPGTDLTISHTPTI